MNPISNVLAERYATEPLRRIWSPEGRIVLEREFWIAAMKAQRDLGLDIPAKAIRDYEKAKDRVDLDSIRRRESVTRHDVKARIDEFCALAGHQHIHKGMTSRDLTENVEQLQILRSMEFGLRKGVAVLLAFARRAKEFRDLVITARTHNVAAQPTTLGRRLAMYGEEMALACRRWSELLDRYPLRGLKGAVGTQMDTLTLFDGDGRKVDRLEDSLVRHLGFKRTLRNVGQVYPRSLDFDVVSALYQAGSAPSNFARTLRLMAGWNWASEGFAKGQTGSSAMPHKMNSRSCERINGLHVILRGHVAMAEGLAGDQWNEGDVSCSVVRRVMLPDAFFALDGLLETTLVVLSQMEAFPGMVKRENDFYGPFLATTTILMEAVKKGAGREEAHEAIKEHAVATMKDLRANRITANNLADRLAGDARLGLSVAGIRAIIDLAVRRAGRATTQVDHFLREAESWKRRFPEAANLAPGPIL